MILLLDGSNTGWMEDFARWFLGLLDKAAYFLLEFMYKVFFTVANANILSPDFVRLLFSRIQLILGIFMIFMISFSLIQYLITPEKATDPKGGAGKMIMRVIVALFLLTLIVPLNIPGAEEPADGEAPSLEYEMNTHGILFGLLYKFQDSMMRENILGKLILGIATDPNEQADGWESGMDLDTMGAQLSGAVARAFIHPNIKFTNLPYCEYSYEEAAEQGIEDPCPNVICPTIVYNSNYTYSNLSGIQITDFISGDDYKCNYDGSTDNFLQNTMEVLNAIPFIPELFAERDYYAFSYTPILGFITGMIMTILILGFTIDVAIRTIKLAVLRLIAPIPIISYVNEPKGKEGGAFQNWTKTLVSTYLDLFIRVAIIYFVLFLIQNLVSGSLLNFDTGNSVLGVFATVFIILGMLFFAKQAPKFFKDMLGIKGSPMGNVGLSGILGGAAMAIGGAGFAGFGLGFMQGANAESEAVGQGKAFGLGNAWSKHRDLAAQMKTGDKDAHGGWLGSLTDRLNFKSRERTAAKLGYGQRDLARASLAKDQARAVAEQAAYNLKRAELAFQSAPDINSINMAEYKNADGSWKNEYAENAYNTQVAAIRDRRRELQQDYLAAYSHNENAQAALAKAEKVSKEIDSNRAQVGIAPRVRDVYKAGYRSNLKVRTKKDTNIPVDRYGNEISSTATSSFVYDRDAKNQSSFRGVGGRTDDDSYASSGNDSDLSDGPGGGITGPDVGGYPHDGPHNPR